MKTYNIRTAIPTDIPFIYSTWLNSYKHDSAIGLTTTKTIFYEQYRLIIDELLARPDTKVYVACKEDDPNVIFGYMVTEPSTIHYAFVKESFWNLGIAKALYAQAFSQGVGVVSVSHKTKHVEEIFQTHPNLIYNPFLLYRGLSKES